MVLKAMTGAIITGLLAGSTAHTAAPAKIPVAFHGEWHPEAAPCSGDIPMDGGMMVSDSLLDSGEDTSAVMKVKVLSPSRIRVYTDDYGEQTPGDPGDAFAGHHWTTLTLLDKGQKLKQAAKFKNRLFEQTLIRCHTKMADEDGQ